MPHVGGQGWQKLPRRGLSIAFRGSDVSWRPRLHVTSGRSDTPGGSSARERGDRPPRRFPPAGCDEAPAELTLSALPGWLVLALGALPALVLKIFTKKREAGDFDSHKWENQVAGCWVF